MTGLVEIIFITIAALLGLSLLAFWLWMLIDCLTRESREGNDRLVWTLVIVLTKVLGAALYYFLRHRKRRAPELAEGGVG